MAIGESDGSRLRAEDVVALVVGDNERKGQIGAVTSENWYQTGVCSVRFTDGKTIEMYHGRNDGNDLFPSEVETYRRDLKTSTPEFRNFGALVRRAQELGRDIKDIGSEYRALFGQDMPWVF